MGDDQATPMMEQCRPPAHSAASSTKSFAPLLVQDAAPASKSKFARTRSWWRWRRWDRQDWKEAGLAAWEDLRDCWAAAVAWIIVLAWVVGLIVLLVMLAVDPISLTPSGRSACQPDGSFNLVEQSFNMWAFSGFFQITLAWGTFTFANAKLIDVVWDVVVGRGGQFLLAWISWSVFSDYVTASIRVSPVTYETFWAFFLQNGPTLWSTWYMARDFVRSRGLQSRAVMVYLVSVAIFVLAFPTFGSAMTGYQANSGAFVRGNGGELLKYSDFDIVAYVIHDGWRVNLTGDFAVTYSRSSSPSGEQIVREHDGEYLPFPRCDRPYAYYEEDGYYMKEWEEKNPLNSRCSMHRDVSAYVKEHGFFGLEDETSTFMNQTLDAPVLNISAFYIPEYHSDDLFGRNWTDPRTQQNPFLDTNALRFVYDVEGVGNETYDVSYVGSYGSCQPMTEMSTDFKRVRETYQWGFSFVQLFVMIILLLLWTLGTSAVWLKANMTLRMMGVCREDKPTGFKGVLELAAAIRRELPESNLDELGRDQLTKEIGKHLRGGNIGLEGAGSPAMYGLARGFWGWVKAERWWHVAWVSMILVGILLNFYFLFIFVAVFLALTMGRMSKSRAILLLGFSVLGTIVFVAVWCSIFVR